MLIILITYLFIAALLFVFYMLEIVPQYTPHWEEEVKSVAIMSSLWLPLLVYLCVVSVREKLQ